MSEFLDRVDAVAADHGLQSEPFLLAGRKLSGTLDGRTLSGSLTVRTQGKGGTEPRRYAGHRLELTVSAPLAGRLIVFQPSKLGRLVARSNRWFGLTQLALGGSLAHLDAWAGDVAWAERLLGDAAAVEALARLLPPGGPHGAGIQHSPGSWVLSLLDHGERVLESLPDYLGGLLALAARGDELPGPATPWQPPWAERHRKAVLFGLLFGCPVILVLVGVLVSALLITLSILASQ